MAEHQCPECGCQCLGIEKLTREASLASSIISLQEIAEAPRSERLPLVYQRLAEKQAEYTRLHYDEEQETAAAQRRLERRAMLEPLIKQARAIRDSEWYQNKKNSLSPDEEPTVAQLLSILDQLAEVDR